MKVGREEYNRTLKRLSEIWTEQDPMTVHKKSLKLNTGDEIMYAYSHLRIDNESNQVS